jgi:hypothetical protein
VTRPVDAGLVLGAAPSVTVKLIPGLAEMLYSPGVPCHHRLLVSRVHPPLVTLPNLPRSQREPWELRVRSFPA